MTRVLIEKGNVDTGAHTGRTSCEEEGRDGVVLLQGSCRWQQATRSWEKGMGQIVSQNP